MKRVTKNIKPCQICRKLKDIEAFSLHSVVVNGEKRYGAWCDECVGLIHKQSIEKMLESQR